jgi:hypothetical protein
MPQAFDASSYKYMLRMSKTSVGDIHENLSLEVRTQNELYMKR